MPYVGRDEDYEEPLASPSAMWTDLYELTMAQALFLEGRHEQQATFHAFVRKLPFNAAYLVTAGQNIIHEWLDKNWRFTPRDLRRLAKKTAADPNTGSQVKVFRPEFLRMLEEAKLKIGMDAMPEGELAFAAEPVYTVRGPIWQELSIETAILNATNSQSDYATYMSILKMAANGKPVIEFGPRRSPAVGALSSTRGCYVGGADGTSNCWAETNYDIRSLGTMAHAYVMVHEDEMEAFSEWAEHNPHLGVFLVDTYNTIEGVKRAIEVCKQKGINLSGIRLDSGDLAYLSKEARKLMDEAGFTNAKIFVSNDLNAEIIASLEQQGAPIDIYAVGTNAVNVPPLGGVYKVANTYSQGITPAEIAAMKMAVKSGHTDPKDIRDKVRDLMKLSDQFAKMTYPGELDLIRYLKEREGKLYFDGGTILSAWTKEVLLQDDPSNRFSGRLVREIMSVRRDNHILSKTFNAGTRAYRPLVPMFEEGRLIGDIETVHMGRERTFKRLDMLDPSHRRLLNPHQLYTGIDEPLLERQEAMGRRLRNSGNTYEANLV